MCSLKRRFLQAAALVILALILVWLINRHRGYGSQDGSRSIELYEPINTLKPVGEGIWVVDGPVVRMASYVGGTVPFPTRMVVVGLSSGDLFVWSPVELGNELRAQIDALGPVGHLVSPNKIHYEHINAWKRAYPEAVAWASPGVRERAASQDIEVEFDADLGDNPEPGWREDLDQLVFRGSRFMEEIVFFHRASRTVILADLIENFEPDKLGRRFGMLARLGGVADPDGKTPLDLRLTFLGRRDEARVCVGRLLSWEPEKVIMAHGRPYLCNGAKEIRRAFRWLRPS